MQQLTARAFHCAVLVVAVVLASTWPSAIGSLAAQEKPESKTWPPRTPDGQPEIQGVWAGAELGTWTVHLEPESYLHSIGMPKLRGLIQSNSGGIADPLVEIRETAIYDPPDGILPYQPWALERRNSVMKDYLNPKPWQMDTQTPGWPTGIPRENVYSSADGSYGGPIHILQPPGHVVFLYETHHEFRIVPLDGRPQPGKDIKLWEGSSRGHWEGNTLVIDVTNNNDSPADDRHRGLPQRRDARDRALDVRRYGHARISGDDRRPSGLHEAVDDGPHLQAHSAGHGALGVRRRRRFDRPDEHHEVAVGSGARRHPRRRDCRQLSG